jgi:hypothetical protein
MMTYSILMNREGQTYRHRTSGSIVVVTHSKRMSAGTTRHTLLCIDPTNLSMRKTGEVCDVDEVPVDPFDRNWEAVG